MLPIDVSAPHFQKNEKAVAKSPSRSARKRRLPEPFQHGERWRCVLVESATQWNRPDLVLEHHRQQLMFDCYG
jgi:hypothetical protein